MVTHSRLSGSPESHLGGLATPLITEGVRFQTGPWADGPEWGPSGHTSQPGSRN